MYAEEEFVYRKFKQQGAQTRGNDSSKNLINPSTSNTGQGAQLVQYLRKQQCEEGVSQTWSDE